MFVCWMRTTKPRMRVWKVVRMRLIVSACDAARDAWVGGGEKGVLVVRLARTVVVCPIGPRTVPCLLL